MSFEDFLEQNQKKEFNLELDENNIVINNNKIFSTLNTYFNNINDSKQDDEIDFKTFLENEFKFDTNRESESIKFVYQDVLLEKEIENSVDELDSGIDSDIEFIDGSIKEDLKETESKKNILLDNEEFFKVVDKFVDNETNKIEEKNSEIDALLTSKKFIDFLNKHISKNAVYNIGGGGGSYGSYGGESTTPAATTLSALTDTAIESNLIDGDNLSWNSTSAKWVPVVATGTDEKAGIDSGATPGYIGASSGDGVFRTDPTIDYSDGGDFITLGVNQNEINHDDLSGVNTNQHIDWTVSGASNIDNGNISITIDELASSAHNHDATTEINNLTLSALSDTDISNVQNNQVLGYHTSAAAWKPIEMTGGVGATTLSALSDTAINSNLLDGNNLSWNSTSGVWIPKECATSEDFSNTVTVALSGANYTSIQMAIDSINGATLENPFVVVIYPGVYNESIVMKSHVSLVGISNSLSSVISGASSPVVSFSNSSDDRSDIKYLNISYTSTTNNDVLISAVNGDHEFDDCKLVLASNTGGVTGKILYVDQGEVKIKGSTVRYNYTGDDVSTNSQHIIRIGNGVDSATFKSVNNFYKITINDQNDYYNFISEDSTDATEVLFKDNAVKVEFNNVLHNGIFKFFDINSKGTEKLLKDNHFHTITSGSTRGYFIDVGVNKDTLIHSKNNDIIFDNYNDASYGVIGTGSTYTDIFNNIELNNKLMTGAGTYSYVNSPDEGKLYVSKSLTLEPITTPTSGENGDFYYNSNNEKLEYFTAINTTEIVTTSSDHNLSALTDTAIESNLIDGDNLAWNSTSAKWCPVTSIGTDEKVGIDSGATPGYIGASSGDGVFRTDSTIEYVDGGDYVTLSVNQNEINHNDLSGYNSVEHVDWSVSGASNIDNGNISITIDELASSAHNHVTSDINGFTLSALTDTDLTNVQNNQVLGYHTSAAAWKPIEMTGGDNTLSALDDTSIVSPNNGDHIIWNSVSDKWVTNAAAGLDDFSNTVTVALSGANYTSIQDAIDSINGATSENPFVVVIHPGIYSESISMKSHVSLVGISNSINCTISATSSPAITFPNNSADTSNLKSLKIAYTSISNDDILIQSNNGKHLIKECFLNMNSITNGVTGKLFNIPNGAISILRSNVLYNYTGTDAPARNQNLIDVGTASSDGDFISDSTKYTIHINDVNDNYNFINLDSTATSDFIFKANLIYVYFNNASHIGIFKFFNVATGGSIGWINSNHFNVNTVGNTEGYFIEMGNYASTAHTIGNQIIFTGFTNASYGIIAAAASYQDTFNNVAVNNPLMTGAGTYSYINSHEDGRLYVSKSLTLEPITAPTSGELADLYYNSSNDKLEYFITTTDTETITTLSEHNLSGLTDTAIESNLSDGDNLSWNSTSAKWVSVPATGTDEKVSVDSGATPGYIGASSGDGVFRTDTTIDYSDGGDFITLGVNQNEINHDDLSGVNVNEHVDWSVSGASFIDNGNISITIDELSLSAHNHLMSDLTDSSIFDLSISAHNHDAVTEINNLTLSALSDTDLINVHNNQVLGYHSSAAAWKPIEMVAGGATTLSALSDTAINSNLLDGDNLAWNSTSAVWIPSTSVGTDEKVSVDSGATPGYIGASSGDGIFRTDPTISYTDNGNFITLGINQNEINHNDLSGYDSAEHIDWSVSGASSIDNGNISITIDELAASAHNHLMGDITDSSIFDLSISAHNHDTSDINGLTLSALSDTAIEINLIDGDNLSWNSTSAKWIPSTSVGTDEKVGVDSTSAPGYIGASSGDGVFRTDSTIKYVDGGDFITLSVNQNEINHNDLSGVNVNEHVDWSVSGASSIDNGNISITIDELAASAHNHLMGDLTDSSIFDLDTSAHNHLMGDLTDSSIFDLSVSAHNHLMGDLTDSSIFDLSVSAHNHLMGDLTDSSIFDLDTSAHNHDTSDINGLTLSALSDTAINSNLSDGDNLAWDSTSAKWCPVTLIGTDEKVGVDSGATPGYIGASSADGVFRTDPTIDYSDGGDFITLGVNQNEINHDDLSGVNTNQHIDWSVSGASSIDNGNISITIDELASSAHNHLMGDLTDSSIFDLSVSAHNHLMSDLTDSSIFDLSVSAHNHDAATELNNLTLSALSDTDISNVQNNQVLGYHTSAAAWKPIEMAAGGGDSDFTENVTDTTTSAQSVLSTITTTSGNSYHVEATIIGKQTNSAYETNTYKIDFAAKNDGALTLGYIQNTYTYEEIDDWGVSATTSGSNINIIVNGYTSDNVSWKCSHRSINI